MGDRTCSVDGCDERHKGLGYCNRHYKRVKVHGDPTVVDIGGRRYTNGGAEVCEVEGCSDVPTRRGWCRAHYLRWQRHGDPTAGRASTVRGRDPEDRSCLIAGCETDRYRTHNYCNRHRHSMTKYGTAEPPPRSKPDGYRFVGSDGYVRVKHRGHPMASTKGFLLEHRYVMAEHLGRTLDATESVHHRNGDKTDNRLQNLELWVGYGAQPSGQRPRDLVAWARSIVKQYGDEVDAGLL